MCVLGFEIILLSCPLKHMGDQGKLLSLSLLAISCLKSRMNTSLLLYVLVITGIARAQVGSQRLHCFHKQNTKRSCGNKLESIIVTHMHALTEKWTHTGAHRDSLSSSHIHAHTYTPCLRFSDAEHFKIKH